jgi:hypothetical protein
VCASRVSVSVVSMNINLEKQVQIIDSLAVQNEKRADRSCKFSYLLFDKSTLSSTSNVSLQKCNLINENKAYVLPYLGHS